MSTLTVSADERMASTAAVREHIGWIDVLRILACFTVVMSHCTDGFVAQFHNDRACFMAGAVIGSILRPCVPLFAMMTGLLLLPIPQGTSVGAFYRKRVGRIVPPLIFWSLALPPLAYLYLTGAGSHTLNPAIDLGAYTPEGLTNRIWSWILNFNYDTTPLWYIYMLVGLYLIMPIMDSWLRQATKKDVETVLKVWAITLFLPALKLVLLLTGTMGGQSALFGECTWNAFSTFYYVSGFAGYLLLAYYLKCWPLQWSSAKAWAILAPVFIAGTVITTATFIGLADRFPGRYEYLEIAWWFCSFNVVMMTAPVFIAAQRINFRPRRWLKWLAGLTMGIFLCHFVVVYVAYDWFDIPGMSPWLRIPLMAVTIFTIAGLVTWLFTLWKPTRRLVC